MVVVNLAYHYRPSSQRYIHRPAIAGIDITKDIDDGAAASDRNCPPGNIGIFCATSSHNRPKNVNLRAIKNSGCAADGSHSKGIHPQFVFVVRCIVAGVPAFVFCPIGWIDMSRTDSSDSVVFHIKAYGELCCDVLNRQRINVQFGVCSIKNAICRIYPIDAVDVDIFRTELHLGSRLS